MQIEAIIGAAIARGKDIKQCIELRIAATSAEALAAIQSVADCGIVHDVTDRLQCDGKYSPLLVVWGYYPDTPRGEVAWRLAISFVDDASAGNHIIATRAYMPFAWIPPGENGNISRGLWLGKYPVTNADYKRFLQSTKDSKKPEYWNDPRFNQPGQPVVGVSWDEAEAFCTWVGGRLPTEAEWEYACRAGTSTEYSFGNDESKLGEYGWFEENSKGQTQPVGSKKPNPWGLFDMHGNVWEWCEDRYCSAEYGSDRVIRGGGWFSSAWYCRSAYRLTSATSDRFNYLGFRVSLGAR